MRLPPPSRADLTLALGGGLWTAAFLREEQPASFAAPLLVLAALLFVRRQPVAATAGTIAALWVCASTGVPSDSPAVLGPLLMATYALGRYASVRAGGPVVAGSAVAVAAVDEVTIANLVFGGVLLGGTWVFGHLVRRRTLAARAAREQARRLRGQDPAHLAARVVVEERARLAQEVVSVVHESVREMRELARAAEQTLSPATVDAISERGREAVCELRRLLGLLRDEPEPRPPVATSGSGRVLPRDVMTAAAALLLGVIDVMMLPPGTVGPLAMGLAVVFFASLGLRRTAPAIACSVASAAVAASALVPVALPHGLGDTLTLALLAWTAASAADRWAPAALVVLAAAELFTIWREDPGNVALTAALVALPAFAGHVWNERDREARTADVQADTLQTALAAEVERAVSEERLRIAREIHDVTSHAVGVMVLHAGAAMSQRVTHPEAARESLRTVEASGTEALAELTMLVEVLEAGSPSVHATTPASPAELRGALDQLAARMGAAGVSVDLRADRAPEGATLAATTYRVVQEALTNVAKHAPGARVDVLVEAVADGLAIRVHDDGGSGTAPADRSASGFGLTGLAERVRSLGGEMSAGPRDEGGFAVEAVLPLHTGATAHGGRLDVSGAGS